MPTMVSIPRKASTVPKIEFDLDAEGIGEILCVILTGKTSEELAKEIIKGQGEEQDDERTRKTCS